MRPGSTLPLHNETSLRRTVTATLYAAKAKVPSAQMIAHFLGQLLLQREEKQTCDLQIRKVDKLQERKTPK